MKTIIASILVLASISFGSEIKLTKKDATLYTLSQDALVSAQVLTPMIKCPPNALCLPTYVLEVTFTLNGCLDKLATVSAVEVNDTYFVTAHALSNKDNKNVRCFAPNTQTFKIRVGSGIKTTENPEVYVMSAQSQSM